jgi:hypothetical protein
MTARASCVPSFATAAIGINTAAGCHRIKQDQTMGRHNWKLPAVLASEMNFGTNIITNVY